MTKITHDTTAERYLITVDGRDAGYADYIQGDGVRDFHHTVIDPEFRGQGLSKPLIQAALDDTRAAGDKVRPLCSAVAGFIEKHPEYRDLIQP
ncbi:GNAT family N-acetyltransferase [uncultured Corynebacterium sp.]|uniref:GNAT family N-acetyltransferase n=1 Tax=uncultured Corynebacterium sp. TaxID=159447 RepID=UPI0028E92B98|nr:GNAT family N-acetyltransferase [uncultured Corynebacterium sp.]